MADDQPSIISREEAIARGLKRFYTGEPCNHQHIDWRRVDNKNCCECSRQRQREHYKTDRKWATAKNKKAYWKYVEDRKERRRRWYFANKEKAKAYKRGWRKRDTAPVHKARAVDAEYRKKNAKKINERIKIWAKANPILVRLGTSRYRARKLKARGTHTAADIRAIMKAQGYRCAYCRKSIKKDYVMDHIIPLARGGPNDRKNMQATCAPCNLTKGAKDPLDFARSLGMLL